MIYIQKCLVRAPNRTQFFRFDMFSPKSAGGLAPPPQREILDPSLKSYVAEALSFRRIVYMYSFLATILITILVSGTNMLQIIPETGCNAATRSSSGGSIFIKELFLYKGIIPFLRNTTLCTLELK